MESRTVSSPISIPLNNRRYRHPSHHSTPSIRPSRVGGNPGSHQHGTNAPKNLSGHACPSRAGGNPESHQHGTNAPKNLSGHACPSRAGGNPSPPAPVAPKQSAARSAPALHSSHCGGVRYGRRLPTRLNGEKMDSRLRGNDGYGELGMTDMKGGNDGTVNGKQISLL